MAPKPNLLNQEKIVAAALDVANSNGIDRLTMRSLANKLAVTPMSIYRYVADKDELLDVMVDAVFDQIYTPLIEGDWQHELHNRAHSARTVLLNHPWALGLLDSRTSPGIATITDHNAVIGTLRTSGFSLQATAQAFAAFDAYIYGFVLQESSLPINSPSNDVDIDEMAAQIPKHFPYLAELAAHYITQPGFSFGDQFDFGLTIVLEGIAKHRL